jgi:hypothetical protein
MDALEERPVLEHRPAADEFAKPLHVQLAQVGEEGQKRLCLRCKIEGIGGFVVIQPMHAVAIIEEYGLASLVVHEETMKTAVQPGRHKGVCRAFRPPTCPAGSTLLKPSPCGSIALARKNQMLASIYTVEHRLLECSPAPRHATNADARRLLCP